jgi:hypothetical protein
LKNLVMRVKMQNAVAVVVAVVAVVVEKIQH